MKKAIWQNQVLAESDETQRLEGNVYFPEHSIQRSFFRDSGKTTTCAWKGIANYYDIVVDGEVNSEAAWYYAHPKEEAAHIKGFIAFWNGVVVE